MKSFDYLIMPFFAYLVAGSVKFIINSLKIRKLAFKQIGLGGMPSTHNTVTASVATLIALQEGINCPAFGVAMGFAFIVALDSMGLRAHIQSHAELLVSQLDTKNHKIRTRLAHTPLEALAGILLGMACAFILYFFI
jgi:acid phosphatase family membrane protein YuiD